MQGKGRFYHPQFKYNLAASEDANSMNAFLLHHPTQLLPREFPARLTGEDDTSNNLLFHVQDSTKYP